MQSAPEKPHSQAAEFLSLLFGHSTLAGLKLAIWDRQTKQTAAFVLPDIPGAAADAELRGLTSDVYFGVCPYSEISPGGRGTSDQAAALIGLWLDVDVRHPEAHKAGALPETDEQAFDLISEMPARVTRIVNSGYGLQAWWLFSEPWPLRNAEDRAKATWLTTGWVAQANERAAQHGWKLDPVGDLARVLRVPGTWNRKGTEPKTVGVVR